MFTTSYQNHVTIVLPSKYLPKLPTRLVNYIYTFSARICKSIAGSKISPYLLIAGEGSAGCAFAQSTENPHALTSCSFGMFPGTWRVWVSHLSGRSGSIDCGSVAAGKRMFLMPHRVPHPSEGSKDVEPSIRQIQKRYLKTRSKGVKSLAKTNSSRWVDSVGRLRFGLPLDAKLIAD